MMSENMLQCYNRCCGQTFDPSSNKEDSCLHHPGVPVFHDAYKKWSCCDKKTTDFTEFLNMKGCTHSYHSNVKPPEPEKPPKPVEVICRPPLEQKKSLERPDPGQQMVPLTHSIGTSLKPLLEKLKDVSLQPEIVSNSEIQMNTPCHNSGCRVTFKGEQSNTETCLYHPGVPVFHEGMKYWSCCIKKTTDFDHFLEQVGCTTGKHKWHKEKSSEKQNRCRYDWHQTGSNVVVSVYCKCPLPERSVVEANPVRLKLHIQHGAEGELFEEDISLFGIVDVPGSGVTFLGSKVEVRLKKAEPVAWRDLALPNK